MGIALLTLSHMFNGLQRLSRSMTHAAPHTASTGLARRSSAPSAVIAPNVPPVGLAVARLAPTTALRTPRSGISPRLGLALTRSAPITRRLPLRVLRVTDSQAQPGTLGRIVISGRMVDVCAELDRLAALESQQLLH